MSKTFEVVLRKENGKLRPTTQYKKQKLDEYVDSIPDGGGVHVTFTPFKEDSSHAQFKYLYGHVYAVIREYFEDDLGWPSVQATITNVDLVFKDQFAREEKVNPLTGEILIVHKDKKNMSKKALSEYINNVIVFCTNEWGLRFQSPEEYYQMEIG